MHTPEYYMGRIERMLDDLLDTQPHRDDLRQNIYDSYVNLAESRDDLLAACKAWQAAFDALFGGPPLYQNGQPINHSLLNEANRLSGAAILKAERRGNDATPQG